MPRVAKTTLKAFVAIALLALAFTQLEFSILIRSLGNLSAWSIAALGFSFLSQFTIFLRWHQMVAAVVPLSRLAHLKIYCRGAFLNFFTPANLGGDIYRVIALKSHSEGAQAIVILVIRERILGIVCYALGLMMSGIALAIIEPSLAHRYGALLTFAVAISGLGVVVTPIAYGVFRRFGPNWISGQSGRWRRFLSVVLEILTGWQLSQVISLLSYSLLSLALWVGAIAVVAVDLGHEASFQQLSFVGTLAEFLRMLSISVQGIGLREWTFMVLLDIGDSAPDLAFLVGAVSYAVLSLTILTMGAIAGLLDVTRVP